METLSIYQKYLMTQNLYAKVICDKFFYPQLSNY